jgi:hypothetical protein
MKAMKTVCVDLDGVLADYSAGWQSIDHIGDPIPGAVEFTKRLSEFAEVIVYTTRCKVDMPGREHVDYEGATPEQRAEMLADVIRRWLTAHGFAFSSVYTGQGKPIASAYVDDRAVSCVPETDPTAFEDALEEVKFLCDRNE